MFYILSEWFRRLWVWLVGPPRETKTRDWDPMDVDPSLQTIDLSRVKRPDFYKTFRTRPLIRHVLPDSVYNISRRDRLHLKTNLD